MNHRCLVLNSLVAAFSLLIATGSHSDEPAKAEKHAVDAMLGKKAGEVRDDNGLKMKLVWCSPGFVTMEQVEQVAEPFTKDDEADKDDPKDKPAPRKIDKITPVKVLVTRGYWLGKYEVTQAEWKQVMATEPWKGQQFTKEGNEFPATFVIWNDAMEFCRKLTQQERAAGRLPDGWEYTLPTEAQWERACRARTETKFSFGNDQSKLGEYAWFSENAGNAGEQYAHRVGQKKPNPWGLYDMHGNACEWCRDWYSGKIPGGRDPEVTEVTADSFRVIRGGGWHDDHPVRCRSAFRSLNTPEDGRSYVGCRVVVAR